VAPGWLDPYIVGHYGLEVANDVFNGVGASDLIVLPHRTRLVAWRRAVGSSSAIAMPSEWSTMLVLHCSHQSAHLTGIDYAACPHGLHAHDSPDVRRLGNLCVCIGNMWV
jgi:hypothetical protein